MSPIVALSRPAKHKVPSSILELTTNRALEKEPKKHSPFPSIDTTADGGDHSGVVTQVRNDPSIRRLIELQAEMRMTIQTRIRATNSLMANIRLKLGFTTGHDEKSREKLKALADKLFKHMNAKKKAVPVGPALLAIVPSITRSFAIWKANSVACNDYEAELKAEMEELSVALPAWNKLSGFKGFSAFGLAKIVGETGDLSNYSNPGKVWKRFGLAPYNGKAMSSWRTRSKQKLSSAEWEAAGYSPRRRSVMFNIGDPMVKNRTPHFRPFYDAAKVAFLAKHSEATKMHCHNHAQRVMLKELIRVVWRAWNGEVDIIANPNGTIIRPVFP
jgi:hypothetical protein